MSKSVTLFADEELLNRAQAKAAQGNSTLDEQFGAWLKQYVYATPTVDYANLMAQLSYAESGHKFSRDEMNER
jgi:hypothetical protein